MSVSLSICKDIEDYNESVLAGMNAAQTTFFLAGFIVGGGAGLASYLIFHIPVIACGYISAFIAAPVILMGFTQKNGMNIFQRLKKSRELKMEGTVYPVSTECPEKIEELIKAASRIDKTEEMNAEEITKAEMKKKLHIITAAGIAFVIFMVAVIAAGIILKRRL